MSLMISPESALGKELATWNRPKNQRDEDGRPGMRAVGYEEFPRMLYRARKLPSGAVRCIEPAPNPLSYPDQATYQRDLAVVEQFNRGCSTIVSSAAEYERALSDGWRDSPAEALNHHEALEREIATAAAEAAAAAEKMTAKAQRERKGREAQTDGHLTE